MLWRYRQVNVPVVDKKHQADQQKQRELKRNHNPARQQRRAALAHVTGAEQPLQNKLIPAVRLGWLATISGAAPRAAPPSVRNLRVQNPPLHDTVTRPGMACGEHPSAVRPNTLRHGSAYGAVA